MDVITCLTVFGEWLKAGLNAAPAQSAPYKAIALHWISEGRYCVAVREVGC